MARVLYENDFDLQQSVLHMCEMERKKGEGMYGEYVLLPFNKVVVRLSHIYSSQNIAS